MMFHVLMDCNDEGGDSNMILPAKFGGEWMNAKWSLAAMAAMQNDSPLTHFPPWESFCHIKIAIF